MRPYAIGLDIGITSVGWAALALDADENPCGIIDLGAEYFMQPSIRKPENHLLPQEGRLAAQEDDCAAIGTDTSVSGA